MEGRKRRVSVALLLLDEPRFARTFLFVLPPVRTERFRRLWSREGRGLSKERVWWVGVLSVFVTGEGCKGVFPLAENTRNGASMNRQGLN